MHYQDRIGMKVQKLVLLVMFFGMVIFFAGCLNTQPVSQPVQVAPTTSPPAVVQEVRRCQMYRYLFRLLHLRQS